MAQQTRPFQVVVWGTTGVVGRLVAEHLTRDYQKQGIKWAMAGRNKQKLESIRENLSKIDPTVKDVPIITADLTDKASMEELSKRAEVVLATAGPFSVHGTAMVEACVATGTNYCDITGESNWVRKMIHQYDEAAKQKGIRIIHMAGFDSIPSDLGVLLAADHLKKQHNKSCGRVETMFTEMKGALSGGTVASLFGAAFDEQGDAKKAFTDPYGLDPPESSRGPDGPDSFAAGYSNLHKSWYCPFFMAPVNTRVVRRSNALLKHAYGQNFGYLEVQKTPGRLTAWLGAFAFAFFGLISSVKPMRSLLIKILPKPGTMPKREQLEGGCWKALVIAQSDECQGGNPVTVTAEVKANGDPGYLTTSRMLLESGLCIALQGEELKASKVLQSGCLTPASGLGHVLVKRLNKCSSMFTFRIVDG